MCGGIFFLMSRVLNFQSCVFITTIIDSGGFRKC